MKYLFKKFWILILIFTIINVPIFILCVLRTNYSLTLKGDTVEFTSVVEVDSPYKEAGSFSTIYVVSLDRSTIFQNLIADIDPTVDKDKLSEYYTHLSNNEISEAGRIQYKSSVSKAIVLAYNEAKKINPDIYIDYYLSSFTVTWYQEASQFRIGDRIIGKRWFNNEGELVETRLTDEIEFREVMSKQNYIDEEYIIIRDGVETKIKLTKNDGFSAYDVYTIDYDTINPKVTLHSTNVGGPSGGLLQTLSIYNRLIEEDITHGLKIAGTGTISYTGNVGAIGGIRQKIPTALDDNVDVFFCVSANYKDALEAYNSLPDRNRMKLIEIKTFYDALEYLKEGYKNDFGEL